MKVGEEEEEEEESGAAYRNFYICLWAIISETTFASRKLPRHKYHKGKTIYKNTLTQTWESCTRDTGTDLHSGLSLYD